MLPTVLSWEERLNLLSEGKDFSGNTVDVNSQRYLELLGEIMDVDEAVRYFAVHSFIIQMDNMFNNQQNFGLYVDKNGKSLILPWDYDLGWGCYYTPYDAESVANWDVDKMFTPDLIHGTADSVYPDFPLFHVIYQNKALMEKYHQYMKDCSIITTLGGKTSSGSTYGAGRFAAVINMLTPKLQAAASETLASHVYYIDHDRQNNGYRQCNQPSALLAGLPNLSKVAALRATGVYTKLEGIGTTICGYGCDMSTIGNAGPGRPSIGGKLTVVDDKTGIFATAEYPQGRWGDAGPSLSVTKLAENDPVMQKIKDRAGRVNILDMDVYAMTNTKTPSSAYQIYIPVPERLIPKKNGNDFTYLFSYSSETDTLERLKTEKVSDHLYSAETASIQYIAVIRQPSAGMISICVLPPANRKPAKVKM